MLREELKHLGFSKQCYECPKVQREVFLLLLIVVFRKRCNLEVASRKLELSSIQEEDLKTSRDE